MMVVMAVPVAVTRVAAAAGTVAHMLGYPAAHRAAPAVMPADLVNRIDGGAAGVVTDDTAVVVAVAAGTGFRRGQKPDSCCNGKDGNELFHKV